MRRRLSSLIGLIRRRSTFRAGRDVMIPRV
jgi:hypothetical protein